MGIYTSDYLNTSRVMGNYWSTSRASLKNQYIRIWTPRPTEARRRNCQLHKWRFGFNLILPKPPPPNTHPHQPARPRADSAGAKLRTLLRDRGGREIRTSATRLKCRRKQRVSVGAEISRASAGGENVD